MQYLNFWVPSATLALFFRDSFNLVSNHYIVRYMFFSFCLWWMCRGGKEETHNSVLCLFEANSLLQRAGKELSRLFVFCICCFCSSALSVCYSSISLISSSVFFFSSFRSVRLCYLSLLSYYFTLLIFCFLLYFHSFCLSNFVPQWSFVFFLVVRWVGSFFELVVF